MVKIFLTTKTQSHEVKKVRFNGVSIVEILANSNLSWCLSALVVPYFSSGLSGLGFRIFGFRMF